MLALLGIASQRPGSPLNARTGSSDMYSPNGNHSSLPAGPGGFSLLYHVETCYGEYPVTHSMGMGAFGAGVKRPLREHHSPPSSAQDNNERSYTSTPVRLHSVDSVNFTARLIKIPHSCYNVIKTYDNPSI